MKYIFALIALLLIAPSICFSQEEDVKEEKTSEIFKTDGHTSIRLLDPDV